jgi:hypothetical protein
LSESCDRAVVITGADRKIARIAVHYRAFAGDSSFAYLAEATRRSPCDRIGDAKRAANPRAGRRRRAGAARALVFV